MADHAFKWRDPAPPPACRHFVRGPAADNLAGYMVPSPQKPAVAPCIRQARRRRLATEQQRKQSRANKRALCCRDRTCADVVAQGPDRPRPAGARCLACSLRCGRLIRVVCTGGLRRLCICSTFMAAGSCSQQRHLALKAWIQRKLVFSRKGGAGCCVRAGRTAPPPRSGPPRALVNSCQYFQRASTHSISPKTNESAHPTVFAVCWLPTPSFLPSSSFPSTFRCTACACRPCRPPALSRGRAGMQRSRATTLLQLLLLMLSALVTQPDRKSVV